MEIVEREKYYQGIINKLNRFLTSIQKEDGSYPGVTNYGYTFSALFWSYCGIEEHKEYAEKALKAHVAQDKDYFDYHWEFNNYALLKLKEREPSLITSVPWQRNKGTQVTNWRLIRIVNAYRATNKKYYLLRLIPVLLGKISNDGLIRDEKSLRSHTRSFQYHTFSAVLIGELFILSNLKIIGELFLKATHFIAEKIMENGRTLYLGRGQEQIFGYSALLYCLELAYKLTHEKKFTEKTINILTLLKSFQREDGSFPLVLNGEEFKSGLLSSDDKPLGWYSYNTPFDYLPFMGVYFCEALNLCKQENISHSLELPPVNEKAKKEIKRGLCVNYEYCYAIPTGGKGYYSDEMPIPFIVSKKNSEITPIYGGDPIWTEYYTPSCIPLPYGLVDQVFLKKNKFFQWCFNKKIKLSHWCYRYYYQQISNGDLLYFFANQLKYKNTLYGFTGENHWIRHERRFFFEEDRVEILDTIKLKKRMKFVSLYPVNFFLLPCKIENDRKNLGVLRCEDSNFIVKIEGIEGKILIGEQPSPFGKLIWIREDTVNLTNDIVQRRIEIYLK
jgi:hypothetical protein